ncbi:uncharacterized protein LOC128997067 [Macrosteles quadrilineatus]|uniref:uncharacterized protein LOC128997067 n=1 Tax=Macrosteles quadrilineatus TaxID=74068 RepID=UPI0023E1CBFD|nr:uncharacterized protein LOC128997067 [Macrosteles quadrilineatus]
MTTYFVVFTYCVVIKTYVSSVPMNNFNISNFKPVNFTELRTILGPQADNILNPIFDTVKSYAGKKSAGQEEASEEEKVPLPQVFRDDQKNIFFDLWVIRGKENRLMVGGEHNQLWAAVQSSPEIQDALNMELWRFISNVLQVRRDDVEIVLSDKQQMARRIVVKARAISERECQQRLHANLQPFTLEVQEEAEAEETMKRDKVLSYTETRSEVPTGPAPVLSEEDMNPSETPNYIKNPSILDKVLKDLMPNQEIIVRGRLLKKSLPNFVARPLLENYQGSKTLKLTRKILEGVWNSDVEKSKKFSAGPRMSCPERISGLTVRDTLSEDGSRVVGRKVYVPIFQNETHDFLDELDYHEVEFKAGL